MPSLSSRRPLSRLALAVVLTALPALAACGLAFRRNDRAPCDGFEAPSFRIADADVEQAARDYAKRLEELHCFWVKPPRSKVSPTLVNGGEGPEIRIQPLLLAHRLTEADLKYGRLIGRIEWRAGKEWGVLGLARPGDVAYVWVHMHDSVTVVGKRDVTIFAGDAYFVSNRGGAKVRGRFQYEVHGAKPNWPEAYADVRLRPHPAPVPGGGEREVLQVQTAGWLTCEDGCCIAEMPAAS